MSASRSRTGSITCCRASAPKSRSRCSATISTRCATAPKSSACGLQKIEGIQDLQVEKQVRIPQLEIRVDYTRAALYGVQPGAVTEQLGAPVERPRRLARGRRLPALRRGDAAARPSAHHRKARRPPDRDAVGLDPGAPDRRHQGDRRAEPDPAGERPPPHRRAREHGRQDRPGRDRAAHPQRAAGDEPAARRHRKPRRHIPGAGGGQPHASPSCR